MSTTERMQDI